MVKKKMGFADAIQNAAAVKRTRDKARRLMHPLRDENGAFTYVGRKWIPNDDDMFSFSMQRRMWLGGISARRGY